jgi:hypothetical protein
VPHGGLEQFGDETPDGSEVVDAIEDVLVSLTFASWNRIAVWLRQLDGLRSATQAQLH